MEIKKMNLGSQGLIVPNIGLGFMGMTGFQEAHMYGKADEQEAIATIHRSLELGGNYLDTADLFTAPNQVQYLDIENMECGSGYLLIIHPDFL